jgi:hypothetical protein
LIPVLFKNIPPFIFYVSGFSQQNFYFFMDFIEAESKIEEWNSRTQDGFGVWAIVPKDGEFSGIIFLLTMDCSF